MSQDSNGISLPHMSASQPYQLNIAGPSPYLKIETQDQKQLDAQSRQQNTNNMISFPSELSTQQVRPALHANMLMEA